MRGRRAKYVARKSSTISATKSPAATYFPDANSAPAHANSGNATKARTSSSVCMAAICTSSER